MRLNDIGFSIPLFPCKHSPQKQEKSYICGIVQLTFTVTGTLAPAWHYFGDKLHLMRGEYQGICMSLQRHVVPKLA